MDVLNTFIDERYESAVQSACKLYAGDHAMIEMMSGKIEFDPKRVEQWMGGTYRLFRGVGTHERDLIVNALSRLRQKREAVAVSSAPTFTSILTQFYQAVPRLWLSAASKIAWCFDPREVVIYDALVAKAMTILEAIDSSLASSAPLGSAPGLRSESDLDQVVGYYERFDDQVRTLFRSYAPQLAALRTLHPHHYPYELRVFDQLLWLLGRGKRTNLDGQET